jgi:outer membrane protein OmpA-like peptidoglycan-associated protein
MEVEMTRILWLAVVLSPLPLLAETPIRIDVSPVVMEGKGRPTVRVTAISDVRGLKVTVNGPDGKGRVFPVGNLAAGKSRELPIDQKAGKVEYRAEFVYAGATEPEQIAFTGVVARPMRIDISRDTVDLAEGRIAFTATEDVARVQLKVFGEGGKTLTDSEIPAQSAAGAVTTVNFTPPTEAVTLVRMTVHDPWGFYNGVEISPFLVEIPHEEVVFDFGKADVLPAEEPKLARTLEEVHKALAKLGNEFKARLYVAGYTDTVASREYNQDLSERRAMAIARWFSGHGLRVRACYQGFGEDSLAVQTPDETPEPRNRRTIHVLGNQTPPVSKVFPRPNWKCL